MTFNQADVIGKRLQDKIKSEVLEEYSQEINSLKERDDFSGELEYFLEIASSFVFPKLIREKFIRPFIGFYCIQAPVELISTFGFHPVRLSAGTLALQQLSTSFVPVSACPIIKSCVGAFLLEESLERICDLIVIPTTCDWRTKLPDIIQDNNCKFYFMELPHSTESSKAQKRWLEEIYALKRYLENFTGKKFNHNKFLHSVHKYKLACDAFWRLLELKRAGLISGTWCILIANAFMLDDVESWVINLQKLLKFYKSPRYIQKPRVYLIGSPLFFPHLRFSKLIEEAGMHIAADYLCTSERLFNSVVYDNTSEYGLLSALAQRYLLPCVCPTLINNKHKMENILATMEESDIKGVIYHVFKGCHPFDMESFNLEKAIKDKGYSFIRIETDYSKEDQGSILTRLEAFKEMLG